MLTEYAYLIEILPHLFVFGGSIVIALLYFTTQH